MSSTPAEWDLPSECPGWTVRDVLSHMVGTELSLLGEPAPDPLSTPSHVHNEVGARNEGWVASLRNHTGPEVLAVFRDVTSRRLAQLRSWPTSRFDEVGPSPAGQVPYREFMRVRVMDCWVHEQDIRVATARPGHRQGPAATLAIGRLASAMPFIVGKKAGAPDGIVGPLRADGERTPAGRRGRAAEAGRAHRGRPSRNPRPSSAWTWRSSGASGAVG